jgi:alpha-1,6-mannosyltransferase
MRGPVLPFDRGYRVLPAGRRLLALLDALRPDVLEVNDRLLLARTADWAHSRGVPALLFAHERIDAALLDRLPGWFPLEDTADRVNRRLAGKADRIVVGSEFAAAEFRRVRASPRVVRLGVDLDAFRPGAAARVGTGRSVQLALVSRLSAEKRPELALAALRVLRTRGVPAALLVLGDGPLRRRLERRAAGLPVRFLGHVADRRCLPHLLGSADLTLAPAPMETFGLAVLESMACGTPVVVPSAGAARELVGPPGGRRGHLGHRIRAGRRSRVPADPAGRAPAGRRPGPGRAVPVVGDGRRDARRAHRRAVPARAGADRAVVPAAPAGPAPSRPARRRPRRSGWSVAVSRPGSRTPARRAGSGCCGVPGRPAR